MIEKVRKVDELIHNVSNTTNAINKRFLPSIKAIVPQYHGKKKKISSLQPQHSQKFIQISARIKKKYETEERDRKVDRKLMNFIEFERVKSMKNYTQICQQNIRQFHQERQVLKQGPAMESQHTMPEILNKRMNLSPRGTNTRTQQKKLTQLWEKKSNRQLIKERVRTEVMCNESLLNKIRLKQEMKELQGNCLRIKKYSQLSIKEIIQSDVPEINSIKKKLFHGLPKKTQHEERFY